MLPLIQIVSVTGIYGLSFLLVWFSVSLLSLFQIFSRKPESRSLWLREILLPAGIIIGLWIWGFYRLSEIQPVPKTKIKIALIQPSVPQEMIWDAEEIPRRFTKLMKLSEDALAEKPDLIVWPEGALPGLTAENLSEIKSLIRQHHVWMIFGADDYEFPENPKSPEDYESFNTSFLFDPTGDFLARYRKRQLVVFGEYLPFSQHFPFLKKLIPIGNFKQGKTPVPFQLGKMANTSVIICFEDIFSHHAREYVTDETDFLLNLTNDGWFGESAQQWQHAINALFRAVENGVPLVRCTNNGLTCWIDKFGRFRTIYGTENGNVYSAGYKIVQIPLRNDTEKRSQTFYNRHGDLFGWSCVGIAGTLVAASWRKKRS